MKWAGKVEFLEDLERQNGVPPAALRDRPELEPHLGSVWTAFHAVAPDRPVGFGLAPIPFSSIVAYADRYGIHDVDEFDRLRRLVVAMDNAVLDDARKEQEAKDKAKNKGKR